MTILRVAGIDPALRNFGLVKGYIDISNPSFEFVVEDLLLVSTEVDNETKKTVRKNSHDLVRAKMLHKGVHQFIKDVNMVFTEMPVGSQNARAMASYGVSIGVLASIQKPLIQVLPDEVKIAAVGNKNASKKDMIAWATSAYPDAPWLKRKHNGEMVIQEKNEHLADAVAVVNAGILTDQFLQAVSILAVA